MKVLVRDRQQYKTTQLFEIAIDKLKEGTNVIFIVPHVPLLKHTIDIFRDKYPTLDYSYISQYKDASFNGATLFFRTLQQVSNIHYMAGSRKYDNSFKIFDNFELTSNIKFDIISISGEII